MGDIKHIIIHHSATSDTTSLSWAAIRHYHTRVKGWEDIGYHAGCELTVVGYECFYGRPLDMTGAHTLGENDTALGFCFVGNYDIRKPGLSMLEAAAYRVLAPWLRQFSLHPRDIRPHREFSSKTCPGDLFDMDILRGLVDAALA
jgi:hypothetical protein